MRESKALKGKQIISLNDGCDLGIVEEIYLDTKLNSIVAIGIRGLFKPQIDLILSQFINTFGQDALLVANSKMVVKQQDNLLEEWIQCSQLQGRTVMSQEGQKIGFISEILLDNQGSVSGFTLGYTLSSNSLITLFERSAVLDVGGFRSPMIIRLQNVD